MSRTILISAITLFSVIGVYAGNTLIANIRDQTSTKNGGYQNQKMSSLDDLQFINEGGNTNVIGDFFRGHYYDPAYGAFQMDALTDNDRVQVSSIATNKCDTEHNGYRLKGHSYNPLFGAVDFSSVYICFPNSFSVDNEDNDTNLGGYAYSNLIGFQNFDGWELDSTAEICDAAIDPDCINDDNASGKFIRIEGNTSSQNTTAALSDQFNNDVRILGEVTKSKLRRDIHQKIYGVIGSVTLSDNPASPLNLGGNTWSTSNNATVLMGGKVRYINQGSNKLEILGGTITGNKTLVVEGRDILISGNIIGEGILGIIALEKDGLGGNIYIKPSVRDIHAILYADKSLLSEGDNLYTENEEEDTLKNQLYIHGSVFSENTLGGSIKSTPECPYYINNNTDCNTQLQAQKYDLNYLRRYKLVQDIDSGNQTPQFGGRAAQTLPNDGTDYSEYPVIIKYNPKIQSSPPPFFD